MEEITLAEYRALVAPGGATRARGAPKGARASGKARTPQNGAQALTASEHQEQAALIAWADGLAGRLPPLRLLLAIPNGARTSMSVARRLKAEGLRKGCPDLFLAYPVGGRAGLWLEMKRADGGRVSPEQKAWHAALLAAGYEVKVCKGWAEAARAILVYLGRGPEEFGLTEEAA